MDEYIKRNAIKERMEDLVAWCQDLRKPGLEQALAMLNEEPAADVAPVVHGRWVPFHSEAVGDVQYCSACAIGFDAKTDYCPNCGAKMDIEDGGDGDAAD